MEEKDRMIAKWAQEDVETLDKLLNNNPYFINELHNYSEIHQHKNTNLHTCHVVYSWTP